MSHFKSALIPKVVKGGYILEQELIYYSDYLGRDLVAPAGMFTDFASVPQFFQSLVPTATGDNRRPSVIHDWLCDKKVQAKLLITQRDADIVFREALEVEMEPVKHDGILGGCEYVWRKTKIWGLFIPVRCFQAIKGMFK